MYGYLELRHIYAAEKVILDDETYGVKGPDVYFVEIEEGRKLECLVALKQALKPSQLTVALDSYDDKCDSFKEQLGTVTLKKSRTNLGSGPMPGTCSSFTSESLPALPPRDASNTSSTSKSVNGSPPSKDLMVVLDYSVPRDLYYDGGAFHVVLVTPSERESMTEEIPELTALGFVYFNDGWYHNALSVVWSIGAISDDVFVCLQLDSH